jgi:hypothetical protein
VFRLADGLLLPSHTASRLTNVGNKAESKPFTFIFGVGISEYRIEGLRCGSLQRPAAEGRAVPECGPLIPFRHFPAEQGERAMPMLLWLPMIFASALWEINGFGPRPLADNDQAAA